MRLSRHILEFIVAAIIVIAIGALAGWYAFLRGESESTTAADTARGVDPSFASQTGSTYQNIVSELTGGDGSEVQTGSRAPRLWQINKNPVAGFGFAASSSVLYFAERSSGNILSADPEKSATKRLTNTLFPKIYEALITSDATAVLRSLEGETITTYVADFAATAAATTTAPETLQGIYFPQGITDIDARGKEFSYLIESPEGGSIFVTSDRKAANQKKIFSSTLSEWHTDWLRDGRFIAVQYAADNVPGYAYAVSSSGTFAPLVSGAGLVVVPQSGSDALLYSTSAGGVSLYAQARKDVSPTRLSITTLADKCAWVPRNSAGALVAYCAVSQAALPSAYLLHRYQGATHTADALWRVDVSAGTAEKVFVPDSNLTLDVKSPTIDDSGTYLAFLNSIDNSLWMLRIASQ